MNRYKIQCCILGKSASPEVLLLTAVPGGRCIADLLIKNKKIKKGKSASVYLAMVGI